MGGRPHGQSSSDRIVFVTTFLLEHVSTMPDFIQQPVRLAVSQEVGYHNAQRGALHRCTKGTLCNGRRNRLPS